MIRNNTIILMIMVSLMFLAQAFSLAAEGDKLEPKDAVVLANNVNIRAGAGLNFEIVGKLNRGARLVAVGEEFGWYKIRLPEKALSFAHKDYIDQAVVAANRLRVRAGAGANFNVIGVLSKGERVIVLEERGDWLKIVPTESCYGWIKVEFLKLTDKRPIPKPVIKRLDRRDIITSAQEGQKVTGRLDELGKIINRCGTHKLITDNEGTYYLRSTIVNLNDYVQRIVQVNGIVQEVRGSSYPVIDVEQIKIISW